jgi:hypothetical protein
MIELSQRQEVPVELPSAIGEITLWSENGYGDKQEVKDEVVQLKKDHLNRAINATERHKRDRQIISHLMWATTDPKRFSFSSDLSNREAYREWRDESVHAGLLIECNNAEHQCGEVSLGASLLYLAVKDLGQENDRKILAFSMTLPVFENEPEDEFPVRRLLTHLCAQLFAEFKTELRLRFFDTSMPQLPVGAFHDFQTLGKLFRQLVYDVAWTLAPDSGDIRIFRVYVDGLDVLERDPDFSNLIELFRVLCLECDNGEIGQWIIFKYLFIHPKTDNLRYNPNPIENRITIGS